MKIIGIDFTSTPSKRKPLTCAVCDLEGTSLTLVDLVTWSSFEGFDAVLAQPGPWITSIDFPFGQATRFVETIGWPEGWREYVGHCGTMDRQFFRKTLDEYRAGRPLGDKEHRREFDVRAGSISPQKLYGVPVGMMFFEGAGRLLSAGVNIPGVIGADSDRTVFEAYPGVAARSLIGRRSYKSDNRNKWSYDQRSARTDILDLNRSEVGRKIYGFDITAPASLCADPGADTLDAFICAVQAAWAWRNMARCLSALPNMVSREGWIADPSLFTFA